MPLPDIRPDPQTGQVDIVFNVKEKQTGSVNFGTVFGGGPYGSTSGRFAGFLGYQQPNLFGQGKSGQPARRSTATAAARSRPATPTRPSAAGATRARLDLPLAATASCGFGNGRRLQTGAPLQFGFPVPRSLRTRAFLGYSLSRTEYLSQRGELRRADTSIFCLPDATASSLSLSLTRDTKNHPLFPTQGTRQSVTVEQTGGPLGGNGNYQKLFAQTEWWVPTGRLGSGPRRQPDGAGAFGPRRAPSSATWSCSRSSASTWAA